MRRERSAALRQVKGKSGQEFSSLHECTSSQSNDLVKAKIAADPFLKETQIRPSTERGQVQLTGKAQSYEQGAWAIDLALECDAATRVISKIEVEGP